MGRSGASPKADRRSKSKPSTPKPVSPDAVFYRIEQAFRHAEFMAKAAPDRDVRFYLGRVIEACADEQAGFDQSHKQWFAGRLRDIAAKLDPEMAADRVEVPAGQLVPGAVKDLAGARWALCDAADVLNDLLASKSYLFVECDDEDTTRKRRFEQLMQLRAAAATKAGDALRRWFDDVTNEENTETSASA